MKNKTEFAIGEEVQMGLVTLVCEEDTNNDCCRGCYFIDSPINIHCADIECDKQHRTDNNNIIFKLKDNGKD